MGRGRSLWQDIAWYEEPGLRDGLNRLAGIRSALIDAEIDAIVCTLPSNVLLLSGYWPVVGASVAIATRRGDVALVIPEDEAGLVGTGGTPDISTYRPGSLNSLDGPTERVIPALGQLLRRLDMTTAILAVEMGPIYEESSYSAAFRFQAAVRSVLRKAAPHASITSADQVIRHLRYTLTRPELDRVRLTCRLAGDAFVAGRETVRPGAGEPEVASEVSTTMLRIGLRQPDVRRCGAFAWCMSGANSARASAAYAVTSNREIRAGDLVLIHANPFVDGYFADVTRTYVVGMPVGEIRAMYDAVFAAREAALGSIRPGVAASTVDRAAREIIERAGFGEFFTHGLGHSVGFSAISADFPPRLHPASTDVLEVGCTFNLEPAIYIEGVGGVRHCDVVTVNKAGPELLTPFHGALTDLVITSC